MRPIALLILAMVNSVSALAESETSGFCQAGIRSAHEYHGLHFCCAASCGGCGEREHECAGLPGGEEQCCVGHILVSDNECTRPEETGCLMLSSASLSAAFAEKKEEKEEKEEEEEEEEERKQNANRNPKSEEGGEGEEANIKKAQNVTGTTRDIVVLSVPPYHGSTALEQLLMSSRNVSTLCKEGCWQCEARFLWKNGSECVKAGYSFSFEKALKNWSAIWDLTRPVLFLKYGQKADPSKLVVATGSQDFIAETSRNLPREMVTQGVTSLRLSILQMWRPLCLANLSSHFRKKNSSLQEKLVREEARLIEASAQEHHAFRAAGVNVLLVSYADLLWRPQIVVRRLSSKLLPGGLLNGVNFNFQPKLGRDIFPGNKWKVQGSLSSFAEANPPATLGYDLKSRSCSDSTSTNALSDVYHKAAAYLREESRSGGSPLWV